MNEFLGEPILEKFKSLLHENEFKFKKSLGQNFLIDKNILKKIVSASEITKNTNVIEIGAGWGLLTYYLAQTMCNLIAIEIDTKLIPILNNVLYNFDNVKIINEDIMKIDFSNIQNMFNVNKKDITIIGNLPYYIGTSIIVKILTQKMDFSQMIFMIQKEVAEKIVATPKSKNYGSLSILVNFYCDSEILFSVSPNSFIPKPDIYSSVIKIKKRPKLEFNVLNEEFFFKIVKVAFLHKRKTLINSLSAELFVDKKILQECLNNLKYKENVRAEEISINQFVELSNELYKLKI
jgi:16S rRNA (adenine1518-N6/adenine1519-N6)-dimethyltransferase